MKKLTLKNFVIVSFWAIALTSCSNEEILAPTQPASTLEDNPTINSRSALPQNVVGNIDWNIPESHVHDFSFRRSTAVTPTECGDTPFDAVTSYYNDALINDFLENWDFNPDAIDVILGDYFVINQIAAQVENINTDSFGANGEYTNYMKQQVRSLEKFWDMPNLISVRGQHTATLEDLSFIRYVYENYSSATPQEIDYLLSIAQHFNDSSDQIPENPFFAVDGFATSNRIIVIGDGLVSMLAETGLDPKVVWSGILAHEWSHQIQFQNHALWTYPVPAFIGTPESTRMTELEADFFTGYYLTHKRGGTYNWKRVEAMLSAFYNIGDCGFQSSGHHGTPDQRLEAARQGYLQASAVQKKGHLPDAQSIHDAFIMTLPSIVGE